MTVTGVVLVSIACVGGVLAGVLPALDGGTSSGFYPLYILPPTGLLLAIGIPLIAVGAHQVPVEPSDQPDSAVSIYLHAGPAGVVLSGTF